jgi:uncharacterized protein (TIGR00251 family)
MSLPFRLDGAQLLLRVKVLPNAGRNQLAGLRGEELLVRLQAQPRKGEANRELLRFLAKSLEVPRGSIRIVSGESSGHKLLRLPGEARERLESHLDPAH